MAVIDELSIEIEGSAKKASTTIDSLVKKLDILAGSLGKINGSAITGLANSVNRLSTAMQGMKNVGTADFTRLAKNIEKLGNINVAGLNSAASSLSIIGKALSGFGTVAANTTQLGEMAKNISRLGNKGVQNAIDNMPKLASAVNDLMQTLSTAPKVSQNLIDMTNALANLGRSGSGIGSVTGAISNMTVTTVQSSGRVKNALRGMQSGFKSLFRSILPFIGIYKLISFGKQAMEISSDLTEVQNVVDVTFGDFKSKIEDLSKVSVVDFGMSELTAKQISSRFQAMGLAMGFSQGKMSDMSIELTKLAADMASFYNVEQEAVAKSLQSVFTGESEPLRKYGLDLTQTTLQEWALNNGLNANIQSMSQAEKTLLRYQYVMANTGAAQGDFARTAGTWANQVRILKQNFEQLASVIGGVLINAFKPVVKAVNAAMSAIIAFAKTISNALGQIFGWTYEDSGGGIAQDFDDAAAGAEAIEDATGGAAKNIKKMQAGLRAFDELKTINMPDNNNGGSGGGGTGGAGGAGAQAAGGKWVPTESILEKFKSDIDTLFKLGEHIGKTLADAMNSIDWDSVYEKARNFGKGLAGFLNGLISPDLFGALGRTIAGALNTAVYSALSFGEEFEWEEFGDSIAEGINEFFKTFDSKSLAKTINTWIKGALKTATSMLKKSDFKMIGQKIGEFLKEIDWIGNIKEVGKLIWEAIKSALDIWESSFDAAPVETGILTAVSILKFTKLGDVLTEKINGALSKVKDGLSLEGIATAIAGVFGEFTLVSNAFEGLISGAQGVGSALMEIVAGAGLAVGALKLIGLSNPWTAVIVGISGVVGALHGMAQAQQEALEKFAEEQEISVFGEKVSDMTKRIDESVQSIKNRIDASMEYVKTAGVGEMQMAKDLADRYFELKEKQNLSNEEMDEMQRLTQILIEKVPELNQYYNDQTGLLDANRQEVDKLIESRLREIQLNAVEEQLTEAYKTRLDALKKLKAASEDLQAGQEKLTQLQNEYEKTVSRRDAAIAYEEIEKLIGLGVESLNGLNVSQELLNQLSSAGVDSTQNLKDIYDQLWEVAAQGEDQIPHWSELNDAIGEAEMALETFEGSYEQVISDFSKMEGAYQATEKNVEDLSTLLSEGLLDAGENGISSLEQGMLDDINKVKEATGLLGKSAVDGYVIGLGDSGGIKSTENAAKFVVDAAMKAFAIAQDSHSPSKVTKGFGKDAVDGYNLGISNNAPSSQKTVTSWVSSITDVFKNWSATTKNNFSEMWKTISKNSSETWGNIKNSLSETWNNLSSSATDKFTDIKNGIFEKWSNIKQNTSETWDNVKQKLSETWSNISSSATEKFSGIRNLISEKWSNIRQNTSDTWNNVSSLLSQKWNLLKENASQKFENIRSNISEKWNSVKTNTENTWDSLRSSLLGAWSSIENSASEKWAQIKNAITDQMNSAKENVESAVNSISGIISSVSGAISSLLSGGTIQVDVTTKQETTAKKTTTTSTTTTTTRTIPKVKTTGKIREISMYAAGGFPEDGLFFANHKELVGQFSNGKTAVANNEQIISGLAEGIYPAVYNAVSAAMRNNGGSNSPEIRVFIGDREITDVAIDGITEITNRTGKTPFPIY